MLVLLAGCANVTPASMAPTATANPQSSSEYLVGPGDVLEVFVWQNMELTRTTPVRPDGRIGLPLVGEMVAAGKTPLALAAEIQDKLRPFVKEPLVTVTPGGFAGLFSQQVRVIGEAAQPSALPYRSAMTVLDAMIQVGGLTRFADGDRAVLVRQVAGQPQSYRVRLDLLIRSGDINQNVDLQPGDILIIPQRYF